jgi:antitoxin component YwqK of YwqJK toxin-antitoxin module
MSEEQVNYTDEDGLMQGKWKFYWSAPIAQKGNYVDGEREGIWKSYHTDGSLAKKENYVNGRKKGKCEWWYTITEMRNAGYDDSTQLLATLGYYDDDVQEGIWEYWFESGGVMAKGKYVNGKKEGVWEERNRESCFKLYVKRTYENGVYQYGTGPFPDS